MAGCVAILSLAAPAAAQFASPGSIAPSGSRIGSLGARRMSLPVPLRTGTRFGAGRFGTASRGFTSGRGFTSRGFVTGRGFTSRGFTTGSGHLPHHPGLHAPHAFANDFGHFGTGLHVSAGGDNFRFQGHLGGGIGAFGHLPHGVHHPDALHHLPTHTLGHHPLLFAGGFPLHHGTHLTYPVPYAIDPYLAPSYVVPVAAQGSTGAAGAAPAPVELTALETGRLLLHAGSFARAVESFREALREDPQDAKTMRLLGMALLGDGRVREGIAMLSYAYDTDPSLADEPLSPSEISGGERRLREWVRRTVMEANRTRSADSWLAVSILMQAEGRLDLAAKMARRAFEEGLDTRVYDAMVRALIR